MGNNKGNNKINICLKKCVRYAYRDERITKLTDATLNSMINEFSSFVVSVFYYYNKSQGKKCAK